MSSRKYIEERRQKRKKQNTLYTLIMVGGIVLVLAAVIIAVISSSTVNLKADQISQPEFTELEQYGLAGLGDSQAPVVIEEYSDFGCSFCADFALETKKLLEDEYLKTGQVSLVFRTIGRLADAPALQQAAEGVYCAGEQGAFWDFHDLLFANQVKLFTNRSANISKTLETFADILELDIGDFRTCVAEGKYQQVVAENQTAAAGLGITGTPTFLINGVILRGNQPIENFQQVIDEILAGIE